jgi:hypothetical protein
MADGSEADSLGATLGHSLSFSNEQRNVLQDSCYIVFSHGKGLLAIFMPLVWNRDAVRYPPGNGDIAPIIEVGSSSLVDTEQRK